MKTDLIVECLENGGVVLLPTDTVYGLAVSPKFDESITRLFALKRRPRNVNLPIMVASDSELESLGFEVSGSARRLLRSPLIPGSLTLAMGFSSDYRPEWLAGREEAAVRIPNAAATDGASRRRSEPSQISSCTSDASCSISIAHARSTASSSDTGGEGSRRAQASTRPARSRLPGAARMWR